MKIAGFEFADGARFQAGASSDAETVGNHLEHLRQHFKGELTARDVLDDARNPNSPLHTFFEWSDNIAAEAYRLEQARGLIRSVVAIYTSDEAPAQRVRAYVHVPEPGANHYRETAHAMSQTKTRELVLKRAWRDLQVWRSKYRDLREFAALIKIVDEIEDSLPKAVRQ